MVCMKLLNCSGLLISVASGTAWLADTLTALGLAALSMAGATGAWLMIPTSMTIVSARSRLQPPELQYVVTFPRVTDKTRTELHCGQST